MSGRALHVPSRAVLVQERAGVAATRSWCSSHGASVAGWTGTVPNLPICGPGPAYGGSWSSVDLPGPGGTLIRYYNATPGFQCVELAERWLALADGLAPVMAEGDQVAANYHATYPNSTLIVDGSRQAVGHPPVAGDVISFATIPTFDSYDDGHVAVVVTSTVNSSGNGTVVIAQQNVSSADYHMALELVGWRLVDPADPADAALQYPYAEWFHLLPPPRVVQLERERAAAAARARMTRAEAKARAMLAAARQQLLDSLAPAGLLATSDV